jgi:hypothetical protein
MSNKYVRDGDLNMIFQRLSSKAAAPSICCGLLLSAAAAVAWAARPAQLDFATFPVGDAVKFRYELRGTQGDIYHIDFRVKQQEIAQAKRRFQAFNPQDLKRQAAQERQRQLEQAVAGLRRAYPNAQIELQDNGTISWRVGPPQDFHERQEQLFHRLMQQSLEQIRADYPQARITHSEGGGYQMEAPNQRILNAVKQRLSQAQAQANQALADYADQEQSRMAQRSGGIGDDLRQDIQGIQKRMQDFQAAYFHERLYKVQDGKYVLPDYARIADISVPDLRPAAAAISRWTRGLPRRESLSRLLLFIQTIPYDRLEDRSTDAGFLLPLVMLDENRGDCDSKSVTYAVLAHRMYPNLAISMVLVPQHAFLALGLPPAPGDRTLRQDGRTWVLAEPVGPGVQPVGRIGKESERGLAHIQAVVSLFH